MSETDTTNRLVRYYIATAGIQAALCIGGFAAPLLAKHVFHATATGLGALGGVGMATYVLCTVAAGHLSDKTGRHHLILLGMLLLSAAYGAVALCPGLGALFLLVVLVNVGQAMFWPPLEAAIADVPPRHRLALRVGVFNVTWCSAVVLGTWLGGRLYDQGPRLPFVWTLLVGAAIVPFLLLREPKTSGAAVPADGLEPATTAAPASFQRAFLRMAWAANFLTGALMSTMRSFFGPDATARLGFSAEQAALLMAAVQVAQTVMFVLLTVFHGWRYKFWFFGLAQMCMIAGATLVCSSVTAGPLVAAFLLIGTGAGVTYTSSLYYSLEGVHERGAKSGFHEAFGGAGASAGPFLAGCLAAQTGDVRTAYAMCAALIGAGLLWETWTHLRCQRREMTDVG